MSDSVPRRWPVVLALTLGMTAVLVVMASSLLAIPLFALARFTEPGKGTGREWFRDGLRSAVMLGSMLGVVGGLGFGWWLRSGGKLPSPGRLQTDAGEAMTARRHGDE